MLIRQFGGIVNVALVVTGTNAIWRLDTAAVGVALAGTADVRRTITFSTARAVGDHVYADIQRDVQATWTTLAVGAHARLVASTLASGGSTGSVMGYIMLSQEDKTGSATEFRQTRRVCE